MSKKYRFSDRELENAILSAKNVYERSIPANDWPDFFGAMSRGGVSDALAKDQLVSGLGALMAAGVVDLGKAKAIYYAAFPKKGSGVQDPRCAPIPEHGGKPLRWIQRSADYYLGDITVSQIGASRRRAEASDHDPLSRQRWDFADKLGLLVSMRCVSPGAALAIYHMAFPEEGAEKEEAK
jgi:hypothetical protein